MHTPSFLSSPLAIARRSVLAAALVTLVTGCASMSTPPMSVADTLANTPSLSTLNGLVRSAGLSDMLKGSGPLTVFAPSNEAFKAVPAKTMDDLATHPEKLKDVLTYHVLPTQAMAADIKNGKVKTVNGAELELAKAGDFVTIGDSTVVTQADIKASNGVIHIIDTVMMPPVKK